MATRSFLVIEISSYEEREFASDSNLSLTLSISSFMSLFRFFFLIGYQIRLRTLVNQLETYLGPKPVYLASSFLLSSFRYGWSTFWMNHFFKIEVYFPVKLAFLLLQEDYLFKEWWISDLCYHDLASSERVRSIFWILCG